MSHPVGTLHCMEMDYHPTFDGRPEGWVPWGWIVEDSDDNGRLVPGYAVFHARDQRTYWLTTERRWRWSDTHQPVPMPAEIQPALCRSAKRCPPLTGMTRALERFKV